MKRRRTPLLVTACAPGRLVDGYSHFRTAWGWRWTRWWWWTARWWWTRGLRRRTRGFGGGPGGRGGNNDTGSHLLTLAEDPAVWDEIKITDDQLGKVTRLRSSISKSSRAFRNKTPGRAASGAGAAAGSSGGNRSTASSSTRRRAMPHAKLTRQVEREATAENNTVLQQETDASLKKILAKPGATVNQYARVQQIDLQEAGPLVVSRPDVAKALNLSPSQIEQVQAIIEGMKQGQDQVDQNRRQFFDSMRQNGGFGGPGGGGPGGGGPGGGGLQGVVVLRRWWSAVVIRGVADGVVGITTITTTRTHRR